MALTHRNSIAPTGQRTWMVTVWELVKDVFKNLSVPSDSRPEHVIFSPRIKRSLIQIALLRCWTSVKIMENLSQEDRKLICIMEDGIRIQNGHYEMPLPFRNSMPNNRKLAARLQHPEKTLLQGSVVPLNSLRI